MQYISCLSNKLKSDIILEARKSGADEDVENYINSLPDCESGVSVEIGKLKTKSGKTKGKRKPSAYNLFIGKCMKQDDVKNLDIPERMKKCAFRWKEQKS